MFRMQHKYKQYEKLILDYSDYHRTLITIIPCILSILITQSMHLSLAFTWMFVLSATLIGLSNAGLNKIQQSVVFLELAVFSSICVSLAIYIHACENLSLFYLLYFIALFLILSLAYWLPRLQTGLIIIGIMMSSSMSFPVSSALSLSQVAGIYFVATGCGILLCLLVNLLLPTNTLLELPVDRTDYFFKRIFRISICVVFALFLAHIFELKHSGWMTTTILVVCQANLGASVKKAGQRLLGTFLGILLAIPVALFIYTPYPNSRWLAVAMLFLAFLLTKRYYLSIFFGVFTLTAIYFVFSATSVGVVTFILDRLFETLIGIIVAVLGEFFIYPRTLVEYVRSYLKQYWLQVVEVLSGIKSQQLDQENDSFVKLDDSFKKMKESITDFRYEPLIYLSKRFQLMKKLLQILTKFNHDLHTLQGRTLESRQSQWLDELIYSARHIIQSYEIDPKNREAHMTQIINYYKKRLSSVLFKNQHPDDRHLQQLYHDMLKIFIQYKRITQTPKWQFREKAE